MLGLVFLVAICVASIAFMAMFLVALWREERPKHSQIGRPYPKLSRGKVVKMPPPGELPLSSAGGKRTWSR